MPKSSKCFIRYPEKCQKDTKMIDETMSRYENFGKKTADEAQDNAKKEDGELRW